MSGTSSHTQALANLKSQLAQQTIAARDFDLRADAAAAEIATAADAVVTAYAEQDDGAAKRAAASQSRELPPPCQS